MSEDWIDSAAELKKRMFKAKITNRDLAAESGYCEAYVSELLTGRRGKDDARQKLMDALTRLEEKRATAQA